MAVLQLIKQELAQKRGEQQPPPERKTLVRGDLAFAFNPLPGAPSLHLAVAAPKTDKTVGPSKYHEIILTAQEVCQMLAYIAKCSEKHPDIMLTLPKPEDFPKTKGEA